MALSKFKTVYTLRQAVNYQRRILKGCDGELGIMMKKPSKIKL